MTETTETPETPETPDTAEGWACIDCLMLLANGETPPEMNEDETAAYLADVERMTAGSDVTLGRMFGEGGCDHTSEEWHEGGEAQEDHAERCERIDFTWGRCDVCGSRLAGQREAVTFWLD